MSQEDRRVGDRLVSTWYQAARRSGGDFGSRGHGGEETKRKRRKKKSRDANLSHRVEGWKLCANAIPFSQVSWKTVQGARPSPRRVHDWHDRAKHGSGGMLPPLVGPEAVVDVAARGSSLFRDIRSVGNIRTYCTARDSISSLSPPSPFLSLSLSFLLFAVILTG